MNRILSAAVASIKRLIVLSVIITSTGALAAEDVWKPRENSPLWQSECGSCHMAFPPALLSCEDWQIVMQGLDKHFGVNASLDAKSRDQIAAFLDRNAGSGWRHSADSQRITETGYFVKKHKSSIRMLMNGRVKTLVDCVACHKENGTENAN
jgi:cytochrome c553